MVIFDVVPRDFKVVKQSPIQGNTGGWQLNFLLPSNATPMAALMANQQSYTRNHFWPSPWTIKFTCCRTAQEDATLPIGGRFS
jgi:hypothetical protein